MADIFFLLFTAKPATTTCVTIYQLMASLKCTGSRVLSIVEINSVDSYIMTVQLINVKSSLGVEYSTMVQMREILT